MAAANAVLENGGKVLLLDKAAFCGGNSTKAASGISAAGTRAQASLGSKDTADAFVEDTLRGGAEKRELVEVLCRNSGADLDWLREAFDIDLPLVSRLGGHSLPRTHRGKGKPPGMAITYTLMSTVEKVAEKTGRARIVNKACVTKLLTDSSDSVIGVTYEKEGTEFQEYGPVILTTGGYGADFTQESLLAQHRPDLLHLPTTNGEHCTGDGVRLGQAVGARAVALERVQVHPTGFVKEGDPGAKVKFLASEVLRSVGGLLLDGNADRFVNELGRHDYITGEMWKHKPPFRLVLNKAAAEEVATECKFYAGRGLMRLCESGEELAQHLGVPLSKLAAVHEAHFQAAKKAEAQPDEGQWPAFPSGRSWDEASGTTGAGKKFFANAISGSVVATEPFYVATVTPVIHYCVGGLEIDVDAAALGGRGGRPIPGLYAAGEVAGGVHGRNRLAGNSLLDCLVFGRLAGRSCARYMLGDGTRHTSLRQLSEGVAATAAESPQPVQSEDAVVAASSAEAPLLAAAAEAVPTEGFTREEVAKHRGRGDCWFILHDQVLNATSYLPHHPGGELAILTFAGKDATAEFDMIHPAGVVSKYAPDAVIGVLKDPADLEKGAAASSRVPARHSIKASNKALAAKSREPARTLQWHLRHMDRTNCFVAVLIALCVVFVFLVPHGSRGHAA